MGRAAQVRISREQASADEELGDLRFRALLGPEQWAGLPAAVRVRFSKRYGAGRSVSYTGTIAECRISRMGWLLAQVCRVIGAPLPLDRARVLRNAAACVTEGGLLLLVDHAAAPPWSEHAHVVFPTVEETVAQLNFDPACWSVQTAEARSRPAVGPSGETGELLDNVIVLRRSDAPAAAQQPA